MAKRFFPFTFSSQQPEARQKAVLLFAPSAAGADTATPSAAGNEVPIEQQLADSFNVNSAVFAYVRAMQETILPSGVDRDWYTKFEQAFSQAVTHASTWIGYSGNLSGIPGSIALFASTFDFEMGLINTYASQLTADPTNATALTALKGEMQTLLKSVASQRDAVSTTIDNIDNFSKQLVKDQKTMQDAIKSAKKQKGVDTKQIDKLMKAIDKLNADIAHSNHVITSTEIAAGVTIFVACVVATFSFGLGLAIAVVAVSAAAAKIVVEQKNIKADFKAIKSDEAEIGALNAEIAGLDSLQKALGNLIELSGQAQDQLKLVDQAWEQLQAEVQQVVTDLEVAEAKADETLPDIGGLVTELAAANADWQTLLKLCNVMKDIDYNVVEQSEKLAA